jgi:ABC-type glycerol-3-phosphate transport system substrate-binding protein
MTKYFVRWFQLSFILLAIIITAIAISSCQLSEDTEENPPTPTVLTTATPRPYRTPTAQTIPTVVTTEPEEEAALTLTVWTIEPISADAEGEAGAFINNSLRNFQRTHEDIDVNVILRKPSGKGGALDFLRTSSNVAPTILPDIVILNATDLNHAYTEELVQSLDGKLDRSIVQDLLPAARKVGTVDGNLVGVPLGLEMEHTVYNTGTFTAPLVLWSDVLSSNTRYAFPAKGVNGLVNDTTLSFYFSSGGTLVDDQGNPTIDERVLRNVLEFYQTAVENEIIDQFGVTFENLVLDFGGSLYLDDNDDITATPFCKYGVKRPGDSN